jgi:hypothetical protein
MRIDKDESRRVRREIRTILLRIWDPIGVKDEQNAQDEYDSYIEGTYELLLKGATERQVNEHLLLIVRDRMGLNPQDDVMERTVAALKAIKL